MDLRANSDTPDCESIGRELYSLVERLYPICRSITGDGLRQTLQILQGYIPLQIHEVPTGTQVFDWTVPREWNIRDAWVKDPGGRKVIDFHKSNLHIVNYSTPVHETMQLDDLRRHLFTLPDHPEWIPYRTSYYKESWGFCLSHLDYLGLEDGEYEVYIDSTLADGSLTYGELVLRGKEDSEVLLSCHSCHPSLCNDNLSGVALATLLARELGAKPHRYSYRFLFIPGTIGAITWLARNEDRLFNIRHGMVLAGLADPGGMTYKKSRRGDSAIDRAASHVLTEMGHSQGILDFDPYGYDERQYCSPGFDLPVGRLSRTPYGTYPEYHTSADDLRFVDSGRLAESYGTLVDILSTMERNQTYLNTNPKCEPQLGRRGLYSSPGSSERALLWVLNYSDGRHDLLDIAELSGLTFACVDEAATRLLDAGLLTVPAGHEDSQEESNEQRG
jgi:aminopeptidase-like protein